MGAPSPPAQTSLERLKALDSLPDLATQLQVARQLCKDSFRAEMILRWLLGKLKASQETRRKADSWGLLSTAIRLLSRQKTSILLGNNGFMDSVRITVTDIELPSETTQQVGQLLSLLLVFAQHGDGTAIKSVLIVSAEHAASLSGGLLQRVYEASIAGAGEMGASAYWSTLEPALQVWHLRKRSPSDDGLFSTNCLVSALLLLQRLQVRDAQNVNKRKRGHVLVASSSSSLEALIAVHVLSPARTVFFESRDDAGRSRHSKSRQQPRPAIKERLGPLKMAILARQDVEICDAVPMIMSIALRSVSMLTPKHRLNERPWIETLVEALYLCMAGLPPVPVDQTLSKVLGVAQRHPVVLSQSFLCELIKKRVFPDDKEHPISWPLIAEAVRMDGSIFVDQALSEQLLGAVTAVDQEGATEDLMEQSISLREDIIVPIMKAFAKSRKTKQFVDAWHRQLLDVASVSCHSIWTSIAIPFSGDVQDAMTREQVLESVDQLESNMKTWATSDTQITKADFSLFAANMIQLYAIITGATSDELLSKLHSRLDILLSSMLTLNASQLDRAPQATLYHLYKLFARTFEMWYPSWATEQAERAVVAKFGISLLQSPVIMSACETAADTRHSSADAARSLVAMLCNQFRHFDEDQQCVRLVDERRRALNTSTDLWDVFVRYPALLKTAGIDQSQTGADPNSPQHDSFGAMAAAIVATGDVSQYESVVAMFAARLSAPGDVLPSLKFLSSLDRTQLSQDQRTTIIDALTALDTRPQMRGLQLSLLLSLLPGTKRDVQLLKDSSHVWGLARAIDEDYERPSTKFRLELGESLQILDAITRTILESWLGSKDHDWGRQALTEFSGAVKNHIRKAPKDGRLSELPGSLVVVKTGIVLLSEYIPSGYAEKLVHQDSKTMKVFLTTLTKEAQSLWQSHDYNQHSDQHLESLGVIVDAFASMPHSGRMLAEPRELYKDLIQLTSELTTLRTASFPSVAGLKLNCFRIWCNYGQMHIVELARMAEDIMDSDMEPRAHQLVLKAFGQAVQGGILSDRASTFPPTSPSSQRVSTIRALMPRLADSTSALLLYRELVATVIKDELNSATSRDSDFELSGAELVLPLTSAAVGAEELRTKRVALQSLSAVIRKQPFLLNQYSVEQTIAVIAQLLSTYTYISGIYTDVCDIVSALFATQRARLQGRFNLLVTLFQALITALFQPSEWKTSDEASTRHARTLARLLESFCNPPQPRRKTKTSELIDEARKAQAHAGQYAQYILHHYCSQILGGSPAEGVREALMPGLWAMIDSIEVNDQDGIKVLSAAMNNSERAVLRSTYDDWKRFGKWEGL